MAKKTDLRSAAEKRIHPRRVLRSRVVFEDESGEGFIYFYSTDLSLGGLFLESDIPLPLGTEVFLSFNLRDGESPLKTKAKVVRVARDESSALPVFGMGVQFVNLPEKVLKSIQDYIA